MKRKPFNQRTTLITIYTLFFHSNFIYSFQHPSKFLLSHAALHKSVKDDVENDDPLSNWEKSGFRCRARVAYDGNGFQGFQLQSNDSRTIQGELEKVLSQQFQHPIRVIGAGRTDACVHARGQAIHFDLQSEYELLSTKKADSIGHGIEKLQTSMNSMLRQDVRIYNLEVAPMVVKQVKGKLTELPWHAIYDAIGKLYLYRFSVSPAMNPLERHNRVNLSWKSRLKNLDVLERTLKHFEGSHDFRAFAVGIDEKERGLEGIVNTTREVYSVQMIDEGDGNFRIEVRLKGALYKMIRNMVGTALDVARGIVSEEQFLQLLHEGASRKKNKSKPAPPEGLTLEHVYYTDF
jgi:tRNA pseudouridine38-40 synthase